MKPKIALPGSYRETGGGGMDGAGKGRPMPLRGTGEVDACPLLLRGRLEGGGFLMGPLCHAPFHLP